MSRIHRCGTRSAYEEVLVRGGGILDIYRICTVGKTGKKRSLQLKKKRGGRLRKLNVSRDKKGIKKLGRITKRKGI